ncbi:hypothetical protein [Stenotrophomonas acidaminiphila]|uniref:hypothetical protein n=1 Tax=Stenotrophomonas acidaminiphila TaxID=128780 RepID=UPI0024AE51A0|nr:hypothetical protein [Stenotrophomonas acidaminiphila]WHL17627.1 hypothetical protein QLF99_11150 [Stenotrophomonas acidaminiphila]
MAITAADLLAHAEAQLDSAGGEVDLRASIGRSYYAAFHSLLPLVEMLPPSRTFKGGQVSHFELMQRLSEWKVDGVCVELESYREFKATTLRAVDSARAKRVIADYRLGATVSTQDARTQIARVNQICRAAAKLVGVANSKDMHE